MDTQICPIGVRIREVWLYSKFTVIDFLDGHSQLKKLVVEGNK